MNRWCRAGLRSAALMVAAHTAWAAGLQAGTSTSGLHAATPAPTGVNMTVAPAGASAGRADDQGRIRIQLVARDQVDLSSEISAKISAMPFRDGDAFRAGQTLESPS